MSKKTIIQLVCLLILLCTKSMYAEEKSLRIQELIPETWFEYPAIEPALPDSYVLGPKEVYGYSIWGESKDVEAYCKTPNCETKRPIFLLRHAYDTIQTGPDSFSNEENISNVLGSIGVRNIQTTKLKWGNYPVLVVEGTNADKPIRFAMIGLNSPNRFVILIRFFSTANEEDSSEIWNTFLRDTRQLDEKEFIKALNLSE